MATKAYAQIPAKALKKPEPFTIEIPEKQIGDLKQLLKLSKLPKPTYESLQEDGRYGLSHKWMTEAKKGWEHFNW
jgi:microsomal epoxide hydrolase